jgi:hypothetical protein
MIPESVRRWLKYGERGLSSETIVSHLTGVPITQWQSPPYDPDDLQRCLKLLDACPELRDRFQEMRTCDGWAGLVDHWDDIVHTFYKEVGNDLSNLRGKSAPRTYMLMKLALTAEPQSAGEGER